MHKLIVNSLWSPLLQVNANELTNGVINAAFMLLFKDSIRLFAAYNEGIINLLGKSNYRIAFIPPLTNFCSIKSKWTLPLSNTLRHIHVVCSKD